MGELTRMHEESCSGLTTACNGLDGLFSCLFSLPRTQNGPLACCSLLARVWLQLLMRTLINAVNAGHGGKWAHAKGYIHRLREILKKVMHGQKRTGGSTTHVPTTVKEYAVILKKEKSFFTLPHAREFGSARNMDDSWRMKLTQRHASTGVYS